jgi:hypothetical protein
VQFDQDSSDQSFLHQLVFSCYDIWKDDQEMRKLLDLSPNEAKLEFDQMRKNYRIRNEFDKTQVQSTEHRTVLKALGFQI